MDDSYRVAPNEPNPRPARSEPRIETTLDDRRGFLVHACTVVVGGIVTMLPFLAGLWVFADPLRRTSNLGGFLYVATLDEIPPDGVPRAFVVKSDRTDAWNRFVDEPIGAVYLRRTSDEQVEALNVVCPHAGCFVDYVPDRSRYQCPCHDSSFEPDGKRIDPQHCPSPRALDSLEVETRTVDARQEVWVKFQNFRAGTPEKIPVA